MTASPTIAPTPSRPGRRIHERRRGRLLCLLALTAALAATVAGTASAATVTTTICGGAPDHVFAPYSEDSHYGSTDCQAGGSGPSSQLTVMGGDYTPGGKAGGFKVDALPGTAFVDYHIASYGPSAPNNGWQQVIDGLGVGGDYQTHYRCGYAATQGNCATPTNTFANGAVARQLRILLFCAGISGGVPGSGAFCPQTDYVVVYGAVLVTGVPQLVGTLSGRGHRLPCKSGV